MPPDKHTSKPSSDVIETNSRITIPLAVILERKIDTTKKWSFPQWSVFAIVAGENIKHHDQKVTVHHESNIIRYFWGGLKLELYKDGSEGYWYNLLSQQPYLFVICNGELSDMEIEPRYVTANQDEATGHLESDDVVLSIPMPQTIRDLLEHYVISYYKPKQKKKRKRKDWVEDSLYAQKARR